MTLPLTATINSTMDPPSNPLNVNVNTCRSKQKRVHFASTVFVSPIERASTEDAKHIWYEKTDLMNFRRDARDVALSFRKGVAPATPGAYRGFESVAPLRQRQRHLSIRCTLSAHRKGLSVDETASIARRCNSWSNEVAFVQACHDYADIYRPDMSCMIPVVTSMAPPAFPYTVVVQSKRRVSVQGDQDSGRRVRQRVCEIHM
eukprot:CAMPEP_0178768476 /NCGR_PEP_ID=MMETSP0744-20121128/20265_1 /TAXON_ID=913974 /ORGANISM="Nitzschia punctata, Strain CCMP561" /LENGTH=202 /DNA_ID=CAMNT_0020424561 /DNA_START=128 /DNA_END=736 /DNA_ORIENTATION=+